MNTNNENTYTAEEIAQITGLDAQTLRNQVKSDIAQGRNKQNWNARQAGNRVIFSKADFENWLKPIGPVLTVPAQLADVLIKLGMAKEEEDNDV